MKVLFEYPLPFAVPHEGQQARVLRYREALLAVGVEVEYLRWYDDQQKGQILHYFGRIRPELVLLARQKGFKVVMSDVVGADAGSPTFGQRIQGLYTRGLQRMLKQRAFGILPWHCYQMVDACVASTADEARMMKYLYAVAPEKIHTIPDSNPAEKLKQLYAALLGSKV